MSLNADYLAAIELENEALRERVVELEALLGLALDAPPVFGLTASEARVLGFLLKREIVTKEAAMTVLYGHRTDADVEIKIVDVFICKIRKKLKPFNIDIETLWGRGYRMSRDAKNAVLAMLVPSAEAAE